MGNKYSQSRGTQNYWLLIASKIICFETFSFGIFFLLFTLFHSGKQFFTRQAKARKWKSKYALMKFISSLKGRVCSIFGQRTPELINRKGYEKPYSRHSHYKCRQVYKFPIVGKIKVFTNQVSKEPKWILKSSKWKEIMAPLHFCFKNEEKIVATLVHSSFQWVSTSSLRNFYGMLPVESEIFDLTKKQSKYRFTPYQHSIVALVMRWKNWDVTRVVVKERMRNKISLFKTFTLYCSSTAYFIDSVN